MATVPESRYSRYVEVIKSDDGRDYGMYDYEARRAIESIPSPADAAPLMDGTSAIGTSLDYAREDHVHPTDTSRQAALVSGTNIKTVNSTSLLGSGNIAVQPTLVSGTNIKTINGNSILGSGNITTPDSDKNVTQTNTEATTNAAYRVILSQNANDTTETNGVRKVSNFLYNPSQASLYIGSPSAEHLTLGKTAITFDNGSAVSSFGKSQVDTWESHVTNGNHSLTAATTQAVYPIKIDSRGHISAYGSAVTVPTASTTAPLMDGTASYGTGTLYARSNHVHPTDTSRAAKDNFVSFTVSSTTTTKSLTSGHIYLLVTKRMNNSAAGGLYIVAPHATTGSVTEVKAGTGTTVSINKVTLTVTTTANNIYCRLVDLNMPD